MLIASKRCQKGCVNKYLLLFLSKGCVYGIYIQKGVCMASYIFKMVCVAPTSDTFNG